jgi:tetratricopeptide (TPR) repeat protein
LTLVHSGANLSLMVRRALRYGTFVLLILPAFGRAQTAAPTVADGDRLYGARDARGALAAYEAAVQREPQRFEPLWKAARSATDLGEFEKDESTRTALYARAREFAARSVRADSSHAEGYFQLARAIGRVALAMGPRDRVKLAGEVRSTVLAALARDSLHPGALHVLGVWNAEIMRLNTFQRVMAKTFLGGKVLSEANWADATAKLERSVSVEPNRIVHHLDLGLVYKDTKRKDLARAQFEWIAAAPVVDYNDVHYKRIATEALRGLK